MLGPMQFWSENHQIGWKAAEYLIGHAFAENPDLKDLMFWPAMLTGEGHRDVGRERVREWLNYRIRWVIMSGMEAKQTKQSVFRYGFSEFNSDTYGPIAYKALASVAALAPDEDIKTKAQMVMNLQHFDHIIGSTGSRFVQIHI